MQSIEKVLTMENLEKFNTKHITFTKVHKKIKQEKYVLSYQYKDITYKFNISYVPGTKIEFEEKYDGQSDEEREAYSYAYKALRDNLKNHHLLRIPIALGLYYGAGDDKFHHPYRISDFKTYENMKEQTFLKQKAQDVLNLINTLKKEFEKGRPAKITRHVFIYGKVGEYLIKELEKLDEDIKLVKKTNSPLENYLVIKGEWESKELFSIKLIQELRRKGVLSSFSHILQNEEM